MIQSIVWSPGSPSVFSIDCAPFRVWTLFAERDANLPPELPIVPRHLHNAFMEDRLHDWKLLPRGRLHYYSRVMGPEDGCWLLLEVKPDEDVKPKTQSFCRKLDELLLHEEAKESP